ncbi:hypothetical protein GCM10010983_13310 [Caulobacter rhizosphaerae]|nr:hypothetical protein GCM10010983_13310 [Caulobacter rhizosphaerae]
MGKAPSGGQAARWGREQIPRGRPLTAEATGPGVNHQAAEFLDYYCDDKTRADYAVLIEGACPPAWNAHRGRACPRPRWHPATQHRRLLDGRVVAALSGES